MISPFLVALQFGLIALVIARFDISAVGPWHFILLPTGFAVGVWALWTNRPDNINIRPEPKAGGALVTRGPYRFVRHPMYLAVMLFSAGFVGHEPVQWLALGALAAVLYAKARREERLMGLVHPGYAEYRSRTRAIIPFLL